MWVKRYKSKLGYQIARVGALSVVVIDLCYHRVASLNGLTKCHLRVLSSMADLCLVNTPRVGFALTTVAELHLITQVDKRYLTTRVLCALQGSGYIFNAGPSTAWPYHPTAYGVTQAGKNLLKQIDAEIDEQQLRINNYHLSVDKRTQAKRDKEKNAKRGKK